MKDILISLKKVFFTLIVLLGPALILIFISTRGCKHMFKELDYFGLAENYTFFDSKGNKHSTEEFKDYTVLINVLQPSCPYDCSISFHHFNHLIYQKMCHKSYEKGSLRIISFVTDGEGNPIKDISSVRQMLFDQVEDYDPKVWMVASGEPKKLFNFSKNNSTLLKEGDEYYGGHAFQELMLLLDKKNNLRMVYRGNSEGLVRKMSESIALLKKEYDKESVEHVKKK
ncbi:MAG: hypothetical protein CL844_09570 [Crocinitomicaceae bacterium]|nr:hypothetical protein [Crocinitomicaceae bacterium]